MSDLCRGPVSPMPAAPRWICILFYTFTLPGHTPAQYRCSPNAELNLLSLLSCFSKLSWLWIFSRNLLYCCHIFYANAFIMCISFTSHYSSLEIITADLLEPGREQSPLYRNYDFFGLREVLRDCDSSRVQNPFIHKKYFIIFFS